jgi:hypothetical protein
MPPKKKPRNISGLRNQGSAKSKAPSTLKTAPSMINDLPIHHDSLRIDWCLDDLDSDWESEGDDITVGNIFGDEELTEIISSLCHDVAVSEAQDPNWIPRRGPRKKNPKPQPTHYAKGPSIVGKASRTQQRLKHSFKNQTTVSDACRHGLSGKGRSEYKRDTAAHQKLQCVHWRSADKLSLLGQMAKKIGEPQNLVRKLK